MKMQGTRRATSSTARACWPSRTWVDAMGASGLAGTGQVPGSSGGAARPPFLPPSQSSGAVSGFQPLPGRLSGDREPAAIRHVRAAPPPVAAASSSSSSAPVCFRARGLLTATQAAVSSGSPWTRGSARRTVLEETPPPGIATLMGAQEVATLPACLLIPDVT